MMFEPGFPTPDCSPPPARFERRFRVHDRSFEVDGFNRNDVDLSSICTWNNPDMRMGDSLLSLRQKTFRIPSSTHSDYIHTNDVLILPSNMTRIKVCIRQQSLRSSKRVYVVAAGNTRLRELARALLPSSRRSEMEISVYTRGSWVYPNLDTKVQDIQRNNFPLYEGSETQVVIDVGGEGNMLRAMRGIYD